jgi:hypothetical protein
MRARAPGKRAGQLWLTDAASPSARLRPPSRARWDAEPYLLLEQLKTPGRWSCWRVLHGGRVHTLFTHEMAGDALVSEPEARCTGAAELEVPEGQKEDEREGA